MTEYKAPTFFEPMWTVTTTSTTDGLRQERNHGLKRSSTEYIGYLDEDHAPVVDMAQEVVRCCDCKYYKPWVLSRPENGGDCVLNKVEVDVWFDGFCAWGERREQ